MRDISIEALRIEGTENGPTAADLLTIGDPVMRGNVNTITLDEVELIDPYRGFAALRMTAPAGATAPYMITVQGVIGGGLPHGQGLRIDAGRTSIFRLTDIHTEDTNVVIGRSVGGIVLDAGGLESHWTYTIDPTSLTGIQSPSAMLEDRTSLPIGAIGIALTNRQGCLIKVGRGIEARLIRRGHRMLSWVVEWCLVKGRLAGERANSI